ncbi:MAG: ChaB family protein [Armatimonadetes bacterium]|nr:ChaB family protein [Armatimonadota bacterium]
MAQSARRAAILDVDGTLVDSNDAHARAWVEALTEKGHHVTFDQIRRLIGMGGDNLLPTVIGKEKDSPEGKELSDLWDQIFKTKYQPNLKPFPQVPQLFERLRERGLQRVIASSATQEQLDALLKIAGVTGLVDATVSADDIGTSKPAPDAVEVALKKAGCAPEQAIMVGDTPYDIESAGKAGVKTIAVRCGGWSDEDLKGAIALYDDPADLLAHLDEERAFRVAWSAVENKYEKDEKSGQWKAK